MRIFWIQNSAIGFCSFGVLIKYCFKCAARNEVHMGDIVEVIEGPLRGRSGTVKHIMRGALFIQSRSVQENTGFMCVQARQCKVRGGKQIAGLGPTGVLATPARNLATPNPYGPSNVLASPAHHGGGGGGGLGGPRGGHGGYAGRLSTQHDKLLEGKKVEVKKGPYRGMRGTIKSATGSHVRVELEARMQTVTVSREHLSTQDGGIIAQAPRSTMGMGMGMAAPGGTTPAHWSTGATATPAHYSMLGSSTPLHPGMTPGRDVSKTPAYDPAWAATPAHPGLGDVGSASSFAGADVGMYGGTGQGPVVGTREKDWIGLVVTLSDGQEGMVTSITSGGKAEVEQDGRTISMDIKDLQRAPISRDDSVRILVGNRKGSVLKVQYVNNSEVFVKDSQDVKLFKETECAKIRD